MSIAQSAASETAIPVTVTVTGSAATLPASGKGTLSGAAPDAVRLDGSYEPEDEPAETPFTSAFVADSDSACTVTIDWPGYMELGPLGGVYTVEQSGGVTTTRIDVLEAAELDSAAVVIEQSDLVEPGSGKIVVETVSGGLTQSATMEYTIDLS